MANYGQNKRDITNHLAPTTDHNAALESGLLSLAAALEQMRKDVDDLLADYYHKLDQS